MDSTTIIALWEIRLTNLKDGGDTWNDSVDSSMTDSDIEAEAGEQHIVNK